MFAMRGFLNSVRGRLLLLALLTILPVLALQIFGAWSLWELCLLYTSDAADERSSVDLGGRRIIKKKKTEVTCNGGSKHTRQDKAARTTKNTKKRTVQRKHC